MVAREIGSLRIYVNRAGGVDEIIRFLSDLNAAYAAHYVFEYKITNWRRRYFFDVPFDVWLDTESERNAAAHQIAPAFQLEVGRVSINSPGFWEVLGSLSPLEQLRKYLQDRHERLKDKEFRNASEKARLQLENDLIRTQVLQSENRAIRERIALLRETGLSDEQIAELIWRNVGLPTAKLGNHQDSGLIAPATHDGSTTHEVN